MSVIKLPFAVMLGLLLSVLPSQLSAEEGRLLVHTQDVPPLEILSHRIAGRSSGVPVQVDLIRTSEGENDKLAIKANFGDDFSFDFSLPLRKIPDLDLSSATFLARSGEEKVLTIEMRFSNKQNCFVNDDGRNRLALTFEKGHEPEVYTITYSGCEPQVNFLEDYILNQELR